MLGVRMREMISRTWLPTLLFAFPIFVFEWIHGGVSPPPVGTLTAIAIVVVPPTWWYTAAVREAVEVGRGAASGALCGAVIVLIPAFYVMIVAAVKGPGDGPGGLVAAAGFVVLVIALFVMVTVGAGIGALAALLQKRGPTRPPL